MNEHGNILNSAVCPNPKNWIFAPNQGKNRNYPTNHCCNICGEPKICKKGCKEKSESGGLVR
jgi:hypothetical protein